MSGRERGGKMCTVGCLQLHSLHGDTHISAFVHLHALLCGAVRGRVHHGAGAPCVVIRPSTIRTTMIRLASIPECAQGLGHER